MATITQSPSNTRIKNYTNNRGVVRFFQLSPNPAVSGHDLTHTYADGLGQCLSALDTPGLTALHTLLSESLGLNPSPVTTPSKVTSVPVATPPVKVITEADMKKLSAILDLMNKLQHVLPIPISAAASSAEIARLKELFCS